jgi:hypothetical protein
MSRPPRDLPEPLPHVVFTVATARSLGVDPERLRVGDLERRVYGVRGPLGAADDLALRCRLFAARLPEDVFFSHSTAARILGAPVPLRFERMLRVHASVPAPRRAPHAAGLIGHSREVQPGDVVELDGLRVSSPARMFCEMAAVLDVPRLVPIADYLIRRSAPLCALDDLLERSRVRDRIARSKRIAAAIGLADDRSESPPESFFRVLLTLAGIPPTAANHWVATSSGRRYRIDLAWMPEKVALEYQGVHHLDPEQRRADMSRRAHLEADGWIVVELNADDLSDPSTVVARVRAALARATSRR